MTKLIYLLNSQQDFVAVFIENLKNNTIPVLLIAPTLIAIVLIIYGVKSDWFAKLFGSARSVTQSRIALQDYQRNVEANFLKSPLSLNEPLDKKDGTVTPATIIERAIQSKRKFSDRTIKDWRILYEADIYLIERTLQTVIQSEILLRLSHYANDGMSIIDCMKSINEFWKLVTKGVVMENGQATVLFPDEEPGYGVTFHKEPERPIMNISQDFIQHPIFDEFLKKLKHQMSDPELTMEKIENILKTSNMTDTPIVFQSTRKILADRWMELFNESIQKIDDTTEHREILELLSQIVVMKKTVDVYPELIDISKELEKNQEGTVARWTQQYRALWEKKLLSVEVDVPDSQAIPSLTVYVERIHADRAYYIQATESYGLSSLVKGNLLPEASVFDRIYGDCLKTAFAVSEKSGSYPFLTVVLEWVKIHDTDDVFGYQNQIQSRLDSFMQMVTVPSSKKLKIVG